MENLPGLSGVGEGKELGDVNEEPIVNPFDNPPFISADGKKPRVKANLNSKFAKSNNNNNINSKSEKSRKQGSKKVELDRSQFHNINFVSPRPAPPPPQAPARPAPGFSGPEVRPDGRVPRVKSNLLAAKAGRARDQPAPTAPPPPPRTQ